MGGQKYPSLPSNKLGPRWRWIGFKKKKEKKRLQLVFIKKIENQWEGRKPAIEPGTKAVMTAIDWKASIWLEINLKRENHQRAILNNRSIQSARLSIKSDKGHRVPGTAVAN